MMVITVVMIMAMVMGGDDVDNGCDSNSDSGDG